MGEEDAPPPDYFLEVYGRMVINSFCVLDLIDEVTVGTAIYIGPSIINHACNPTATVSFDLENDCAIVVRALKDISGKVIIFIRLVSSYIACTFHIDIIGLELSIWLTKGKQSIGLLWDLPQNFCKHH